MRIRSSHLLLDAAGESAAAVGEGEGGEVGEGDGDAEGECGQRGEGQHRVEAQDEQEDGDLRVLPSLSHSLFFWQCFHIHYTMVGAGKWLGRMVPFSGTLPLAVSVGSHKPVSQFLVLSRTRS